MTSDDDLELCVRLVLDAGLATGHASTHIDLMMEVLEQYIELLDAFHRLKQARNGVQIIREDRIC